MMRLLFVLLVVASACSAPQTARGNAPTDPQGVDAPQDEVADVGEFDFTSSAVEIAEVALAGELLRPVTEGRVPAAIIVHDWGVTPREGTIGASFGVGLPGEVAVYRGLAEGLAARGVAVLIFDKRSCASSEGPDGDCPTALEERLGRAADLRAALGWLAKQEGISSVNLIAHGTGSHVALGEARHEGAPGVRSVVLLHPMMGSPADLAKFQIEESIRLIDERIAAVGDTPEADLLKQKRTELQPQLANEDLLGLGKQGNEALNAELARSAAQRGSPLPPVLVIEAGLDPGEPATEGQERRAQFGEDHVKTIANLSRAMVSVGEDDDATVVSGEVVTRVSAFLRAPQRH